jgi:hypothetical protein
MDDLEGKRKWFIFYSPGNILEVAMDMLPLCAYAERIYVPPNHDETWHCFVKLSLPSGRLPSVVNSATIHFPLVESSLYIDLQGGAGLSSSVTSSSQVRSLQAKMLFVSFFFSRGDVRFE